MAAIVVHHSETSFGYTPPYNTAAVLRSRKRAVKFGRFGSRQVHVMVVVIATIVRPIFFALAQNTLAENEQFHNHDCFKDSVSARRRHGHGSKEVR